MPLRRPRRRRWWRRHRRQSRQRLSSLVNLGHPLHRILVKVENQGSFHRFHTGGWACNRSVKQYYCQPEKLHNDQAAVAN